MKSCFRYVKSFTVSRWAVAVHFLFIFVGAVSAQMDWVAATKSADWQARYGHSAVAFDNKLWVLKGCVSMGNEDVVDDVWCSVDGISWTEVVKKAAFPMHAYFPCVNFQGKIWIVGGHEGC